MVHVGIEGWLAGVGVLETNVAQLKVVGDVVRSEVRKGTTLHVKHHPA